MLFNVDNVPIKIFFIFKNTRTEMCRMITESPTVIGIQNLNILISSFRKFDAKNYNFHEHLQVVSGNLFEYSN